jgi:hypothetical protein
MGTAIEWFHLGDAGAAGPDAGGSEPVS